MSFQFNSKGFFQIFLSSFLFLLPFTLFLIFSKYGNFIGGGYNFYYILAMLLLLLFTAFLNCYRKNPFLDLTNLFFLLTFILPAVFSHMDGYFNYRFINDFTIAKAFSSIVYQYLIFTLSILFINPGSNFNFSNFTISTKFIKFLLVFVSIIILLNIYEPLLNRGYFDTFPAILQIAKSILNSYIALLILFFVLFFRGKNFPKVYLYLVLILMGLFIFSTIYSGSRSIIFTLIIYYFFFSRFKESIIKLNLQKLLLLPSIAFLSIFTFLFGSIFRRLSYDTAYYSQYSLLEMFNKEFFQYDDFLMKAIGAISSRLSYVDFSVNKISSSIIYVDLININYYFKAIVDKLSPGFDLYNLPFVTRSVYYVTTQSEPSEKSIMNSELIPIYAELDILFGIYSILFTISFFYFFKKLFLIINKIKNKELAGLFLILLGYYLISYNLGMALDFFVVFFCYLMVAILLIYTSHKIFFYEK